ncbi:MAG: ribonuclease P protein component [Mycoplasma sp.]|nr:ribonuclease P protein component [Mycoplasma sp.]
MHIRNRLRKNTDFQKVIGTGKQFINSYYVVYYKNNNLENTRYGLSVSKKFINAVGRNKVRRKIRHILDKINIFNVPFDIVIIARKKVIENNAFDKLHDKLKILLEQVERKK